MLINYETIRKAADRTVRKYKTDDVYRLCKALDINIVYYPIGKHETAVKGFYTEISRIKMITLNSDLPEEIQRVVIAHELGHSILKHRNEGICRFHEYRLFDDTDRLEYEANVFAAELMLSDEAVQEVLNADTSFFTAASALGVPPEILDFKFRMLKRKGYQFADPPIYSKSNFLKKPLNTGKPIIPK